MQHRLNEAIWTLVACMFYKGYVIREAFERAI